jgi:hypothetical protein
MSEDENGIEQHKKPVELWEYDFYGHKSYYDPNHNIMFGRTGLALYKEHFGERLKVIKKSGEHDKTILRQSTSLLPRDSDISKELFQRRKRIKFRK